MRKYLGEREVGRLVVKLADDGYTSSLKKEKKSHMYMMIPIAFHSSRVNVPDRSLMDTRPSTDTPRKKMVQVHKTKYFEFWYSTRSYL